ncbi:MAG: 16S rRNA (cytidine(1402)-2'-O)-methyltransferase [Alphaproteobacteria bacterium]|nr:16S rRNA (cytidine(1402)-2'-O)-methyltransferase [Alphaproteobacteria bacterium]
MSATRKPSPKGKGTQTREQTGRAKPTDSAPRSKPAPSSEISPGLTLVATPIGNAADITLRALDALRQANVIACEDTRVSRKLLTLHGIATPTLSYHEHNAARMRPRILERLRRGEAIALVTDAGMPLISDPGFALVRACLDEGFPVTVAPGASASLAALVLSGLPSDRFLFAGFPPTKAVARRTFLEDLGKTRGSLIFYESPRRLAVSLEDMAAVLGPRQAVVAREITKLHEEVRRGSLTELADAYSRDGPPRGEVVVVVAPPQPDDGRERDNLARELLELALEEHSLRDAADAVSCITGVSRRKVYDLALALKGSKTSVDDPGGQ